MAAIRFARPRTAIRLWRAWQPPASSPPPSRQGRRCRRPDEDHRRHQCVFEPASAPAPEYESTPGTAHNRRSGPADRCHTGRDQALHPRAAQLRHAFPEDSQTTRQKYRSVARGRSARRPRSPSITATRRALSPNRSITQRDITLPTRSRRASSRYKLHDQQETGGQASASRSSEPNWEPSAADTGLHEPATPFDSGISQVIQLRRATWADARDLVRIEVVGARCPGHGTA